VLTVATCFWQANRHTAAASSCYTPEWVNRLARGFARNLTIPHRFVVLTDRHYVGFDPEVTQERLSTDCPDWASMIEPFRIEGPLIVAGLDTVICGNIDHLATWCLVGDRIALPRSPGKDYACNGIAFVPAGYRSVYEDWDGVRNDMEWLRTQPHVLIDKLYGSAVVSYKCDVRPNGLGDARVVYFHGRPKTDSLLHLDWVREHWR
jgi:hypothetical protein